MRWPSVRGAVGAGLTASGVAPVRRGREEWKNWERKGWKRSLEAGFADLNAERAVLAEK
jgi:hypothetical protein